jgi:glycosyltransferase involved in cell wall biosynthesis
MQSQDFLMRIVMFSITPLFPDFDMGGAQKHLRRIALHLAEAGHTVTLLCTRRADTRTPFEWHANARVLPILPFKQPFPSPYDTGAHNLAAVIQAMAEHLAGADVFYMHDGELLFPFLYQHMPTVISLRDNVYPETMQGMFHFSAHRLIVISEYARRFVLDTAGRFYPELPERLTVIPNSLDMARYAPASPMPALELARSGDPALDPDQHAILLHPHRPEESKGLFEAFAVLHRLVHTHGVEHARLLVPRWLNVEHDPGVTAFYARAEAHLDALGLRGHVVFHPWVPVDLLPSYYSLGRVTLALGHFVETFGNVPYESLACGTPAIAARISTHRELLPDSLIDKVDYGDHDAAAAVAARIIRMNERTRPETLEALRARFDPRRQLDAYAATITGAQAAHPMRFRAVPIAESRFRLPVWCYRAARGVYHDFHADYRDEAALLALVDAHPGGFTLADAAAAGVDAEQVMAWLDAGYVTPAGLG